MHKLRIVFMGTPEFATHSLKVLIEAGCNIVGVITAPDKPAGRGQKLNQSSVKQFAIEKNLKILQPINLKDPQFIAELKGLKPQLQIIVAFRMLPEVVWTIPPLGTFNLHASLLPQYRGAAPINHAIINGEKETGVTTFFLKHEIDTGNIIFQEKVQINNSDTAGIVHDKLKEKGSGLVIKTVKAIAEGNVSETPQDIFQCNELIAAPKLFKDDCKINWDDSAIKIYNKIRGLSPYPTSWTEMFFPDGTITGLKIFFSHVLQTSTLKPGEVTSDGKKTILVGTGLGDIQLTDIQLAGKKRMPVEEFLKGYRWQQGTFFK